MKIKVIRKRIKNTYLKFEDKDTLIITTNKRLNQSDINEILMYFRKANKYSKDISINESIGFDKEGNEIAIQDVLKTENIDFCDEIDLKDNISALYKYMDALTAREKEIIINRYGLDGKDEETQKNISKKMGISRSYVSRIEKRALTKLLREFIKNNKIS